MFRFVLTGNLVDPTADIGRKVDQHGMMPADIGQIFDGRLIDQPDAGQVDPDLPAAIPIVVQNPVDGVAAVKRQPPCDSEGESAIGDSCGDLEHMPLT